MDKYYSSIRTLSVAIILLAISCTYISIDYFNQSLVLKKSRADFGWWFAFGELKKDLDGYRAFKADTPGRKPLFFYSYFSALGHCFIREQNGKLRVQISDHKFDLGKIEPSFYASVAEMPSWQVDLDLKHYEPTMVTDLILLLIEQASKEQGGQLTQDRLLPQKIDQEQLKRLKQLQGSVQFFGLEFKEDEGAPALYRRIQKEFEKQKVKIPALDLSFFALSGVWIMAVISAIFASMLNSQVGFIRADEIGSVRDPWIVFDAVSRTAQGVSLLWLLAFAASPLIIGGTLIYMNYASAWIDGFVASRWTYAASGIAIAFLTVLSCRESWLAAKGLKEARDLYWRAREKNVDQQARES